MKKSLRQIAALLTAVLLLCLCLTPAAAESPVDTEQTTTQAADEPETKTTMTPDQLQAQGILTVGAKGEEVKKLQQRLKDLGYLSGKVDGQFGGGTKRAVIAFQRRTGLDIDGAAGQETLAKLYAEDAVAAAKIRAYLAQQGTPIGPYDLQIAAQGLTGDLIVVTHNFSEFSRIPGLIVEDWA